MNIELLERVREHPIIFQAHSVQQILAGKKTQTRRLVKPQPSSGIRDSVFVKSHLEDGHGREIKVPYNVGDRLWVREAYSIEPTTAWYDLPKAPNPDKVGMAAYYKQGFNRSGKLQWKSPIFMPRWASRITLEITDVSVERLQEITGKDCAREGIELERWKSDEYPVFDHGVEADTKELLDKFQKAWNAMHEKSGNTWESNPWIWKIEFRVLDQTK